MAESEETAFAESVALVALVAFVALGGAAVVGVTASVADASVDAVGVTFAGPAASALGVDLLSAEGVLFAVPSLLVVLSVFADVPKMDSIIDLGAAVEVKVSLASWLSCVEDSVFALAFSALTFATASSLGVSDLFSFKARSGSASLDASVDDFMALDETAPVEAVGAFGTSGRPVTLPLAAGAGAGAAATAAAGAAADGALEIPETAGAMAGAAAVGSAFAPGIGATGWSNAAGAGAAATGAVSTPFTAGVTGGAVGAAGAGASAACGSGMRGAWATCLVLNGSHGPVNIPNASKCILYNAFDLLA